MRRLHLSIAIWLERAACFLKLFLFSRLFTKKSIYLDLFFFTFTSKFCIVSFENNNNNKKNVFDCHIWLDANRKSDVQNSYFLVAMFVAFLIVELLLLFATPIACSSCLSCCIIIIDKAETCAWLALVWVWDFDFDWEDDCCDWSKLRRPLFSDADTTGLGASVVAVVVVDVGVKVVELAVVRIVFGDEDATSSFST